jgi:hypothetical protein
MTAVHEVRRVGRFALTAEYAVSQMRHGGEHLVMRSLGLMTTDQLTAAVLGIREQAIKSQERRPGRGNAAPAGRVGPRPGAVILISAAGQAASRGEKREATGHSR